MRASPTTWYANLGRLWKNVVRGPWYQDWGVSLLTLFRRASDGASSPRMIFSHSETRWILGLSDWEQTALNNRFLTG